MRMCVLSSEDLSYLSSVLDGLQRAGGTPVDAVPSPPASAHSLLSGEWDSQLLGFLPIEQQMSPIASLQLLYSALQISLQMISQAYLTFIAVTKHLSDGETFIAHE